MKVKARELLSVSGSFQKFYNSKVKGISVGTAMKLEKLAKEFNIAIAVVDSKIKEINGEYLIEIVLDDKGNPVMENGKPKHQIPEDKRSEYSEKLSAFLEDELELDANKISLPDSTPVPDGMTPGEMGMLNVFVEVK